MAIMGILEVTLRCNRGLIMEEAKRCTNLRHLYLIIISSFHLIIRPEEVVIQTSHLHPIMEV